MVEIGSSCGPSACCLYHALNFPNMKKPLTMVKRRPGRAGVGMVLGLAFCPRYFALSMMKYSHHLTYLSEFTCSLLVRNRVLTLQRRRRRRRKSGCNSVARRLRTAGNGVESSIKLVVPATIEERLRNRGIDPC